jgi:hypothetical protein
MHFDNFSFGSIQIDGSTYEHDVVIDRGEIRKCKKKPSKKFRDDFGHTPLRTYPGNPANSWSVPEHTADCTIIRQLPLSPTRRSLSPDCNTPPSSRPRRIPFTLAKRKERFHVHTGRRNHDQVRKGP